MNSMNRDVRVLLIENESQWAGKITERLKEYRACKLTILDSYDRAATFLGENQIEEFDAAIIDVRLREHIYDQGGLALLDILKSKNPNLPTLILTAYAYDHPGLREITTRYRDVFTYDKEVFQTESSKILQALFSKLPPQIGDVRYSPDSSRRLERPEQKTPEKPAAVQPMSEILVTAATIALILISMALVLLLFQAFSNYPFQLNVVFSIVAVTLLCLLIRLFKPGIVREAVKIFKSLAGRGKK